MSSRRGGLDQFEAQLTHFDVARAQCAKDDDTQRLLACVEVGFGTFSAFNDFIRATFRAQLWLPGTRAAGEEAEQLQNQTSQLVKPRDLAETKGSFLELVRASIATVSRPGRTRRRVAGDVTAASTGELPLPHPQECPGGSRADSVGSSVGLGVLEA